MKLKDIQIDSKNGYYFKKLKDKNIIKKIPNDEGIYCVLKPRGFRIELINPENNEPEHYSKEFLGKKFKHHRSNILYIGKANRGNGLQNRIRQYVNKCGHKGGRAIWQILNYDDLKIQYYKCTCSGKVERGLLQEFFDLQTSKDKDIETKRFYYPFANFKK